MMFASNKCVSCGMCAKICPNHAIEMKSFFDKKRPFRTYHCENCMRCMAYCKKKAVEAGHSWILLLTFIMAVPAIAQIAAGWTASIGNLLGITNYWLLALLNALYYIPALLLSYWIFWMLIRIPVVNALFSLTTLTHYFKRFHDPETRVAKKSKTVPVRPSLPSGYWICNCSGICGAGIARHSPCRADLSWIFYPTCDRALAACH